MASPINGSSSEAATKLPAGNTQPVALDVAKANQASQQALPPVQTDTTRCWSCKRKVGLLGFKCKCQYVFCSKHRYSNEHGCTYDYQGAFKQQLAKENPVVVTPKIPPL